MDAGLEIGLMDTRAAGVVRMPLDERAGKRCEDLCQLFPGLESFLRVFLEAFEDNRIEGRRDLGADCGWNRARLLDDAESDLVHRVAVERALAGEKGEEDNAEREEIGAAVDSLARDLLRRHEIWSADELAVDCQIRGFETRNAEVGDFRRAICGQNDIGRFDVAVDNTEASGRSPGRSRRRLRSAPPRRV